MTLTPRGHERHEMATALLRACDAFGAIAFLASNKPRRLRDLAQLIRTGRAIDADELESAAKRLKALSAEALHALAEAHALASVFAATNEKEAA